MTCAFCGRDPHHRSEMGEPLGITCCETMIWMLSDDEETAEVREAIWKALSKRVHAGDFAISQGPDDSTVWIERTDDGAEGEGRQFCGHEFGEAIREFCNAGF
jgi:hypothetical protein